MSSYLLLFTLGPVQEFIAQARRTRDLWHGSHLLSELSRQAASCLIEGGAELIFPALNKDDIELQYCAGPIRHGTGRPPLNIANKLLAEVRGDSVETVRVLAVKVRDEVKRFWRETVAQPVKSKDGCANLLPHDTTFDAVWTEQIDTLLEFSAAWAPLDDYRSARAIAEQAVAARKNLRDFTPWKHSREGAPKSSLDGARETVLLESKQRDPHLVHKYRIAPGEQLDAVGLVKRAGGDPTQFVPIINVALASWIQFASRNQGAPLEALREVCGPLGLSRVDRPDLPCARAFPFDASILLPNRWKPVFEEQGLTSADPEGWGRAHVRPLLHTMSEPYPYVACLAADGDNMGSAINELAFSKSETAEQLELHRQFSHEMAGFAEKARRIVENHLGSLVYSGGDDVLAFLPIPEALACAYELEQEFARAMKAACGELRKKPSLSVGIGIGHAMDGMGELLALGREAETLAKSATLPAVNERRNALAVIVDKRSGGRHSWRSQWDHKPVETLTGRVRILRETLPIRKLYEIARVLGLTPDAKDAASDKEEKLDIEGWAGVLLQEVRRSLGRSDSGLETKGLKPEDVDLRLEAGADYPALRRQVSSWIDCMLVARMFLAAAPDLRDPSEEVPA